jgi:hypothetical protein
MTRTSFPNHSCGHVSIVMDRKSTTSGSLLPTQRRHPYSVPEPASAQNAHGAQAFGRRRRVQIGASEQVDGVVDGGQHRSRAPSSARSQVQINAGSACVSDGLLAGSVRCYPNDLGA